MKSKILIESSRTPDGFYRRILFLDYFQAGIYHSELANSGGEWISSHIFRNKRDAWKHYRREIIRDFDDSRRAKAQKPYDRRQDHE